MFMGCSYDNEIWGKKKITNFRLMILLFYHVFSYELIKSNFPKKYFNKFFIAVLFVFFHAKLLV
jgi:hypothetical protein